MDYLYHGTSVQNGIKIAKAGAILSPFEQTLRDWQNLLRQNPNNPFFKERSVEELALDSIRRRFGEHEIECRGKSVSLVTNLGMAGHYALRFDSTKGGIVLGFSRDFHQLRELGASGNKQNIYIPSQFPLDALVEIYLSPKAILSQRAIKEAFAKYNPRYSYIPPIR